MWKLGIEVVDELVFDVFCCELIEENVVVVVDLW